MIIIGINRYFSVWKEVTSGVPLGSVFGMQLYTIYINDMKGLTLLQNLSKIQNIGGRHDEIRIE